ncbi:MAG: hypothetical protein DRI61_07205 [Chloroflexi bacterium]|nr:MAG: hypothetical protein DRI61_07205 [Chloroflexota bacterium]
MDLNRARYSSATISGENLRAFSMALLLILRLRSSSANRLIRVCASASTSLTGIKMPSSPSSTTSSGPPERVAITGTPRAIASTTTLPKVSQREGTTTTSARFIQGYGLRVNPGKETAPSSPNSFVKAWRYPFKIPSPRMTSLARGKASITLTKALSNRSNPFSGMRRPTATIKGLSWDAGIASSARAHICFTLTALGIILTGISSLRARLRS